MPTGTIRDNKQVKQLQDEIIAMQKQMGWTKARLAEVIYCELNEEDEDDEDASIQKFTESLKKQLKRDSTPPELLKRYIRIICNHDDYRKAGRVVANPVLIGAVDISILRGVSAASKRLLQDMEYDTEL
ncbi:hypothetical protein MN202_04700 [Rheinheimera muenzenbergensis]|uniref:Uncharacterized protein n=1 Tax=Rheinheimera muenzenbergensis TaxID=1193628 RepID=A0ABU8C3S4_9GAMM